MNALNGSTVTAAQEYLDAGWALCRIGHGTKTPLGERWPEVPVTVPRAFAGVGIGLIHERSRTCCLDVDDLEGATAWLANHGADLAELLQADDAVQVTSGRAGRAKLLYSLPPGLAPLATRKVKRPDGAMVFELRCAGAQDVLPPSTHPNGNVYAWAGCGDWRRLPELPRVLMRVWHELGAVLPAVAPSLRAEVSAPHPIVEGGRNDALAALAGTMRRRGMGAEAIAAALLVENDVRCRPPLPAAEVQAIARSVSRYAPADDVGGDQRPDPAPPARRKAAAPEPEPFTPVAIDARTLMESNMPEPFFVCRPWIAEGVTLVVGRPKVGKTTLLRQFAHAANTEGPFLSAPCAKARVLFLSLEEGERLMRFKLNLMGVPASALEGVTLVFEWPQGTIGAEAMRTWLEQNTTRGEPVVIVVDSLARFREPPDVRANAFLQDYAAIKALADLCKDFPGLAVLVLHHINKAMNDDPVASISGTYGLTAAAENYLIVLKQGDKFRLHAGGRTWLGDASDFEVVRATKGSAWTLLGEWDLEAAALPPKQAAVVEVLRTGAKTRADIAKALDVDDATKVSHLLKALEARNLAKQVANGWELVKR